MSKRPRDFALAGYFVLAVTCLTWPVYEWVGRMIEPRVAGVPFSLVWVAGWSVLTCLALAVHAGFRRDDRDRA